MARAKRHLHVYTGSGNVALASTVAQELGVSLTPSGVARFSDGETHIAVSDPASVKGATAIVMQSGMPQGNDRLVELLFLLDALKRLRPRRLIAVLPFVPYRRQEKGKIGETVAAALVARLIEVAGASRALIVDPHSPRLQEFFSIPVETVTALPLFTEQWKKQQFRKPLVVAQDGGALRRAQWVAAELDGEVIAFEKKRGRPDEVDTMLMNPKHALRVRGATCLIVDDEINTAGTLVRALEVLKSAGARAIHVAATHAVFSGPAIERLRIAPIASLTVTDSIGLGPDKRIPSMHVLSLTPLLVKALRRIVDQRK